MRHTKATIQTMLLIGTLTAGMVLGWLNAEKLVQHEAIGHITITGSLG